MTRTPLKTRDPADAGSLNLTLAHFTAMRRQIADMLDQQLTLQKLVSCLAQSVSDLRDELRNEIAELKNESAGLETNNVARHCETLALRRETSDVVDGSEFST